MEQGTRQSGNRAYKTQGRQKNRHYNDYNEDAWGDAKGRRRGAHANNEKAFKRGYRAQGDNYAPKQKHYDKSALLQNQKTPKKLFFIDHDNRDAQLQKDKAIEAIKAQKLICPRCGQVIDDIASSIEDRATKAPIHFECAMSELSKEERLAEGEKLCYIGQGRFAVLYYENPREPKTFKIKKILPWEKSSDPREPWRAQITALYSQVE